MSLAVLPLAITMNAGPQIMSAIIFVTASKPLKLSAYFLAGVAIAVTAGVTVTFALATLLGSGVPLGDSSENGSIGNIIQYLLVGLLVFLSIKNYLGRETIEPPRWLGALRSAKPRTAFTDRKSTRLNSSHANISYAVFCLKKKNTRLIYTVEHRDIQ